MTAEGRETGLVADAQVISCNASRCIRAGEPSCVGQRGRNSATFGSRPGSFVAIQNYAAG